MPGLIDIVTPLGKGAFVFQHVTAREEMSRLSVFEIDMLSEQGGISADNILGQSLTLKLQLSTGGYRCFNGYVTRFEQLGLRGKHHAYHVTVRPWLWLLTRTADCRIFQDKTVPEILQQVFADHTVADTRYALSNTYRRHGYCVQYRETDFNFVSRLMEQEGIYYFFTHTEGRHTLVLADAYSAHAPNKGYDKLVFNGLTEPLHPELEYVSKWGHAVAIQPGRYATDAFDFEHPNTELAARSAMARDHALSDYEVYEYPGDYVTKADGDRLARTRLEELQAQVDVAHGEGNVRGLSPGALFTLGGQLQADQNQEYLVLSTTLKLSSGAGSSSGSPGDSCACTFSVSRSKQPFRPRRATPRPFVQGPQTAMVVGPAGEEIHTDSYGRVKLQFHWDRYGKKNDNSSCWVRVSQSLAGKGWGMVMIPRIGQEVIVDFLEGDPDQPIITGRVYNADQMPPWALPANKTQSGVMTRSTKGGSVANANAIRFEDKKGSEQLWIHAEKNQDIEVENDETHWVGHDHTQTVEHNEVLRVGSNHSLTVGAAQVVAVAASQSVSVGASQSVTVGVNLSEVVGGAQSSTVAKGRSTSVGESDVLSVGKNLLIEAGDSVTIKTGSASITMQKDGSIQIKGKNITIEGTGKINVKASGDLVMKGSKILQN